jgi:signal transduction histidine kinase
VLERVVRRAIESFRRRHPVREIEFTAEAGGVIVDADRTWLELVIENLLSNADKYSLPGATIGVRLSSVGHEVEIVVADRGIGFGDADPGEVFQPFYRGEEARQRANGIGVGLAVCQRIVVALGGRIWARPRDGGGAQVGFALPVTRELEDVASA